MSLFNVDVPKSPDVVVKIRFMTGRGQPFIAWQGAPDANEADVLREMCESPVVCQYIRKASANHRLKPDESGAYRIPVKVTCYASGQALDEGKATEVAIYPLGFAAEVDEASTRNFVAMDVIRTLVDSLTQREAHTARVLDNVNRLQESYEKTITTLTQHSVTAMDKVSGHASSAFSSAAAPFAEMSKSLVGALNESRAHASTQAKEYHEQLTRALTNRIIEGNKVQQRQSLTEDIKGVLELLPMVKGFLGEPTSKT